MTPFKLSFRARLIAVAVLVEVAVIGLLMAATLRTADHGLVAQTKQRVAELNVLLNAALAAPLAQRDYATLHEILGEASQSEGLSYLVLSDQGGKAVASVGWPDGRALPTPSANVGEAELADGKVDLALPIRLAGQHYGNLAFGVATPVLLETRGNLLRQGGTVTLIALVLTVLVLALVGYWLTRQLVLLAKASERVAKGDFEIDLPIKSGDELGQLTQAFNAMAMAVRERLGALAESQARFHAIADFTYDMEWWLSPQGQLLWVNPSVARMLGYTPGECLAMTNFPLPLVAPADWDLVRRELALGLVGNSIADFEFQLKRKGDGQIPVAVNWQPIFDASGKNMGLRASVREISALKASERKLRDTLAELSHSEHEQRRQTEQAEQERARLVALLSAMNTGILFVGSDGRVVYHNPAFNRIWMVADRGQLIGMPATEVLASSTSVLSRPDHFSRHMLAVLETREVSDSFEIQMADGRVVTQLNYPVRDKDGKFIGHLWIYEDVTNERQTAEQLVYLAERDSLTGLFNRHRFQQEMGRMIDECERGGVTGALLFFDLDEFKVINDNFGHRAGDALLIRVAGEVSALIRRNEILARLGGDEFAVLVNNTTETEVTQLAERIVRAVGQIPFRFEGQNLRLTASLGIALYPTHATETEALIAHADAAMYQAKLAGKNTWRVYRADLDTARSMAASLGWNQRIANALEKGLLRLHFQGVYRSRDNAISHMEALVRMVDEENPGELIMPGRFIPVAEKSGKILNIDRWVLAESVRLLKERPDMRPLAVNISGRSFDDPSLPQYIGELLRDARVEPKRLVVELTETSAVSDLADAQRFIEALRVTGCGICLDDFGSGFASFAYLKHLAVDTVKIDGLFIRNLPHDHDNQVFVKAIVDVARGMGKQTVAEFVEDAATLGMLRDFGVDMVQGYFLDKPRADHPALG
ncbi:MAG: EAL domain-containing protein [Betaproteobacteria bacterium]|nr:EAL domain-containing protein [Betaproteobacteria bacterium]